MKIWCLFFFWCLSILAVILIWQSKIIFEAHITVKKTDIFNDSKSFDNVLMG